MKAKVLKVIGCVIGFIVLSSNMQSQTNNLYFNQVILVGNTPMTVPAGKVWKVEGFFHSNNVFYYSPNVGCSSSQSYGFYVNGILCSFPYNYSTASGSGSPYVAAAGSSFPLWLPAGTTLRTDCSGSYLSVIEFNVAP